MYKFVLPIIFSLISFNSFAATAESSPKLGCAPREEIEKIIGDGGYEILFRGNGNDNKITEIWFNGKGNTVSLNFTKPLNDDRKLISVVCVIDSTSKTTYNGDSVELLYKALEKVNPKL
jgi:hypothetical protein